MRSARASKRCLAVAGMAALCGCALFTTFGGPGAGFDRSTDRRVPGTALLDLKGVVHCHSHLSHDSDGTLAEIAAAAAEAGHDFVVMTDHQTPESIAAGARGMVGGVLFVVGAELRTRGGTLLAFPLERPIAYSPVLPRMLAAIHAQGALALVGHAERFTAWDVDDDRDAPGWSGLDGVEVINLHAAILEAPRVPLVLDVLLGSVRAVLERTAVRPDAVLERYDERLRHGRLIPLVAGNDAHANVRLLGPLGGTIGTYREVLATLSTHVLAEELGERALVEALRRGRSYVVFDLFGDGGGFDFRLTGDAGDHVIGSTVAAAPGQELVVRAPRDATLELLHDGVRIATADGRELRWPDPAPGDWRVEVYRSGRRPWIFSSPIRVVAREAPR